MPKRKKDETVIITLPHSRSRKLPTPVLSGSGAKGLSQPRALRSITQLRTKHPCFARSHYNINADGRATWERPAQLEASTSRRHPTS